jgi:prepilin-type N-terminal cleavage/methylation domain-containing protein/prepilin-type processing-associated H-X9-DG protein
MLSHSYRHDATASQSSRRSHGFTLIELLVVIAIIALLAAILFPVFARARENARRASCQSNLKQMALGIEQYKQDYDSKFPMASTSSPSGTPPGGIPWGFYNNDGTYGGTSSADAVPWNTVLQPYLKSTQILQCPSMNLRGFINYFYNSNLGVGVGFQCQYSASNPPNPCVKSESMLIAPAVTIMFGDGGRYTSGQVANCHSSTLSNCPKTNPTGSAAQPAVGAWTDKLPNAWPSAAQVTAMQTRHLGGINFAFADGHVKWLSVDKLTYDNPNTGNPTFNATGVS